MTDAPIAVVAGPSGFIGTGSGLRTEPELVLESRWVLPETLTAAGYRFEHPELRPALREISARVRPS